MALAEVIAILQSQYKWPAGVSPAPKSTAKALETKTDQQVANTLESFCRNQAQNNPKPWGFTNPDPEGAYVWYRYKFFCERKEFWEYDTAIALGQVVEPPEDKVAEAQTVTGWFDNMEHLRNQFGYPLCDQATYDERKARSLVIPPEWVDAGVGKIYQLAVLRGTIDPTGTTGFSQVAGPNSPKLNDVRGLDAQQWMENEAALHYGIYPRPWEPIKPQS